VVNGRPNNRTGTLFKRERARARSRGKSIERALNFDAGARGRVPRQIFKPVINFAAHTGARPFVDLGVGVAALYGCSFGTKFTGELRRARHARAYNALLYARALFFFFFSLYHNVVEEGSRTFAHPISRISLYLLFRYLRTCSYCCLIPVLSVPYAGNSPFSSLHEGDVGTDREINLGLLSRYDLCFAFVVVQ